MRDLHDWLSDNGQVMTEGQPRRVRSDGRPFSPRSPPPRARTDRQTEGGQLSGGRVAGPRNNPPQTKTSDLSSAFINFISRTRHQSQNFPQNSKPF